MSFFFLIDIWDNFVHAQMSRMKFYILILCFTRNGTSNFDVTKGILLYDNFFMLLYKNNSSAQFTNFTLQIFSFPAQHKPSNDAASSPHQGNTSKVQLPSQVFGSFSHQHKALGIGHYLRGIQGLQNKNNRHVNNQSISFAIRFWIFSYPAILHVPGT